VQATLRYWRLDPRYLAGIAGFLIGPIVLIVIQMINPQGSAAVAVFAPSLLGLLVGFSVAQDLSYDGTALWLHISSGISGAEDRRGRVMSAVTVYLPLTVILPGTLRSQRASGTCSHQGLVGVRPMSGSGVDPWWAGQRRHQEPTHHPGKAGGLPAAVFHCTARHIDLKLATIALVIRSSSRPGLVI
jgi:ABC-2 type transport system permease protein